jgi:hypothetical protein
MKTIDLQLKEDGDFGTQNCLKVTKLILSRKLHFTTEPPIS